MQQSQSFFYQGSVSNESFNMGPYFGMGLAAKSQSFFYQGSVSNDNAMFRRNRYGLQFVAVLFYQGSGSNK